MKKWLSLIMIVLFLTGCSVQYDLTINDDLTVSQTANLTGTGDFFNIYNKTLKINVVKMFLDESVDRLDENNYNYSIRDEDKTPYVLVEKEYNNVKEFCEKDIFFKQYFEKINYDVDKNIVKITTEGFMPNDPENPERYDIKELTISITSKYMVVDHNASDVDEKSNTYYWNIDNNTEDFELLLSFNSNIKFNPYIKTYVMIGVSILIVILTWVVIWHLNKKEKIKNEI